MVADNSTLQGKVCLVTGAARRVGRVVALRLATAGMDVAITYRDSESDAQALVAQIQQLGRTAIAIRVDLSQAEAIDKIETVFKQTFTRLDALINNASTFEPTPLDTVSTHTYDHDMAVNARAPLMLTQAFAPLLAANYSAEEPHSPGRIVNFIDIHVLGEPLKGYISYNASKAALMEITATSALELAPQITVNAIAPGVVDWADSYSEKMKQQYMRRVPLARPGTAQDVAASVLFLVRDASYCTGQIIKLDGGRSLT